MEEIKEYLEQRIEWLRKHNGKETARENELQRVLDLINAKEEG